MQSARKMLLALLAMALVGFLVPAGAGAQTSSEGGSFPDPKPLIPQSCTPVIGVSPDPVDFGSVPVGQTALLDVVISDNEGDAGCSIELQNIELTVGSGFFELIGLPAFPASVTVGQPLLIQVRFSPSQTGQLNGVMAVTSDDPLTPVKEVQLRGVGSVENQPPVCAAGGPYVGFVGTSVTFDGAGSNDPDGTIDSYAWTFGDGGSATGVAPSHTYTTTGVFTVTLIVTDNNGASSECTSTASITEQTGDVITVTAPNGGEEFAPGEVTQVAWTSEGDIPFVDIELSTDGGTSFEAIGVSEANDGSFDWTVPNRPTATARIRVKDSADGNPSDVSDANFTINGVRVTRPNGGEAFVIGTVESITWDRFGTEIANARIELSIDGGFSYTDIEATTPNDGSYDWTVPASATTQGIVRISDAANALATDLSDASFSIVEQGQNLPPTCAAGGPYTGTVNVAVAFDGTGSSDPDGTIASYAWNFGDGSSGSGPTPSHTYTAVGSYTVSLTVTDNLGATSTCSAAASIAEAGNLPPACDAGGPYTGTVDVAVAFDGTGSNDPDGTIASYTWNFGDGSSGSGPTPSHTYTAAGAYTVSLTVTDNLGATSTCSAAASITGGANLPPACDTGGPYAGRVDEAVDFDGRDSIDPDGTIASYAWNFGDGTTGSGPTPSHTYTAAGSYEVTLTVTDNGGAASTCTTDATITTPPTGAIRVAVPPSTFAPAGADVSIPVFILDDVTGLGIVSTEFELRYNPKVLTVQALSFLDTIGEGATSEWTVVHRNENEDLLRVAISWPRPIGACGELVNVLFQMTRRSENRSYLELDILFNEGKPAAEGQDGQVVKGILGDVNGSGQVSSIDATLVLQEVVGLIHLPDPEYPEFTVEVADVSGNFEIRAYDAALMLQYVLGIIDHFPAEEDGLSCDPGGRHTPVSQPHAPRLIALEWLSPTEAVVVLDDGGGVLGVELLLAFDPAFARVIAVEGTGADMHVASRIGEGRIELATALARPVSGRTEIARIRFAAEAAGGAVTIESPSLNEGLVPVTVAGSPLGAPGLGPVVLAQNHPNPFNPATQIRFTLLTAGPVDLSIFDLAGRRVRSLVHGSVAAGTHSAEWNGRDDMGGAVAAGVYLYTLDAAGTTATRKMILLK